MSDFTLGQDLSSGELEVELNECDPLIFAALSEGIQSLTPVQKEVLPHGLAGSDILAKAKTGTGKTLAFLIPTVERLLRLSKLIETSSVSVCV